MRHTYKVLLALLIILGMLAGLTACEQESAVAEDEPSATVIDADNESEEEEKAPFVCQAFTVETCERVLDIVETPEGYKLLGIRDDGNVTIFSLDRGLQYKKGAYTYVEDEAMALVYYGVDVHAVVKTETGYALYEWGCSPSGHAWETQSEAVGVVAWDDDIYFATRDELWWEYRSLTLPEPEPGWEYQILSLTMYDGVPCALLHAAPVADTGESGRIYRMSIRHDTCDQPVLMDLPNVSAMCMNGPMAYYLSGDALMRCPTGGEPQYCGDLTSFGVPSTSVLSKLVPCTGGVLLLRDDAVYRLTQGGSAAKEVNLAAYIDCDYLVTNAIAAFNRSQDKVVVHLRQYEASREAQLNLDIMSGKVDAVVTTTNGGLEKLRSLAAGGRLTPLAEVLPEECTLQSMLPNLVEACREQGEVYYLPVLMGLDGLCLPASVMQQETFADTMALDAALAALNSDRFYRQLTRSYMLECAFGLDGFEEWIDREDRTAHFESESFVRLLEIINRFAADSATVEANADPLCLHPLFYCLSGGLYSPASISELWVAYARDDGGEAYAPYGLKAALFPPPGQAKGLSFVSEAYIAVINKENAALGQVLGYLFSDEVQRALATDMHDGMPSLPVKSAVLEELLTEAVGYVPGEGGQPTALPEAAAMQAAMRSYIEKADHLAVGSNGAVGQIVKEEAYRYFAGDITAEKAAAYIQNRVQLYLDEQG